MLTLFFWKGIALEKKRGSYVKKISSSRRRPMALISQVMNWNLPLEGHQEVI